MACYAGLHLKVCKGSSALDGRTITHFKALEGGREREEEVADMLGGWGVGQGGVPGGIQSVFGMLGGAGVGQGVSRAELSPCSSRDGRHVMWYGRVVLAHEPGRVGCRTAFAKWHTRVRSAKPAKCCEGQRRQTCECDPGWLPPE